MAGNKSAGFGEGGGNGGRGADTINVNASLGTQPTITAGSGAMVINLAGSYTLASDLGLNKNVTLNVNGGKATFTSTQHFTTLNVNSSGLATLTAGANKLLIFGSLQIDSSSSVDLNDNAAIDTGDSLAAVNSLIASGRGASSQGLISTSAATNSSHNTALGALTGSEFDSIYGAGATFQGQPAATSSILIKYTYNGDADFNGKLDSGDYHQIDTGYQSQGSAGFVDDWFNGDFDYNGVINSQDYNLIDSAYQTQIAGMISPAH